MTGLSAHVIRIWEKRYEAVAPERTSTNRRIYSDAEIERLRLLRQATEGGHSIGNIASLPLTRLKTLVAKAENAAAMTSSSGHAFPPVQAIHNASLKAVRGHDSRGFEETMQRALLALGHQGLLRQVIAPLAQTIGELWRTGVLTAADEHFFTVAVKVFLGDLTRQFATPLNAPRIIVATPTAQLHELGAVMAAATAANLGWRAIYLGPSLPAHEIAGAALRNEAAAVALSIVYPEDDPNLPRELTDLARLLPASTRILAGGRAARGYFETLVRIGALYADSIEEFSTQLDSLRRTPTRKSNE